MQAQHMQGAPHEMCVVWLHHLIMTIIFHGATIYFGPPSVLWGSRCITLLITFNIAHNKCSASLLGWTLFVLSSSFTNHNEP
mmetsp:Transcript_4649/g.8384  ORF Transcript_4649/g.8384 Transcript_4649/m.8384 type:complete len:82 (-) Transcript_4649:338-583(-)